MENGVMVDLHVLEVILTDAGETRLMRVQWYTFAFVESSDLHPCLHCEILAMQCSLANVCDQNSVSVAFKPLLAGDVQKNP